MKKLLRLCAATIGILLILFPYIKAEYNTHLYGSTFSDGYLQTGMITSIEYLKVIGCTKDTAEVVYVVEDHVATILLIFVKEGDEWQMKSWEAIWSKSGSADKFMWPYYQ